MNKSALALSTLHSQHLDYTIIPENPQVYRAFLCPILRRVVSWQKRRNYLAAAGGVYDYTDDNGKRHYASFTAPTEKEANYLAAKFAFEKKTKRKDKSILSFGDALDSYISNRESILSPGTIKEYKRIRRNELQELMDINIYDITQDIIQAAINNDARVHSPKTVRNNHGLIASVFRQYRPDFALNTAFPKKIRPDLYVPSDGDVRQLIASVKDTEMELPVLLAAFGPMRRGEICALNTKNIRGNVVHVCCSMVRTESGRWIIRQPKSYAGDRYIDYPAFVAEKWAGISGNITNLNPSNISDRFSGILTKSGLPHFRFHDLRHYSASIQHALGIPDSYIMQRGGWGNDGVLKSVYRHTMDDRQAEMNNIANQHFEGLCNTDCNI